MSRASERVQRDRLIAEPLDDLRRSFLRTVNGLADGVSAAALSRVLEVAIDSRGSTLEPLELLLAWDDVPLLGAARTGARDLLEASGAAALRAADGADVADESEIPDFAKRKGDLALDVSDQAAVDYVRERGATLVQRLSAARRATLRDLVESALRRGDAPPALARRMLREKLFGLTTRDSRAVTAYRRRLIDQGTRADRAAALAERYAKQLLAARAVAIARFEMADAYSFGQSAGWRQAVRDKLIPATARARWNTVDPCDVCEPLEGKTARVMGGLFYPGGHKRPPLHPHCACYLSLVTRADARRMRRAA